MGEFINNVSTGTFIPVLYDYEFIENKYYHRQMIVIFILWLNVTVSLYITLFKDVDYLCSYCRSMYFSPLLTPLLLISIFKEFKGDENDGSNRKYNYQGRTDNESVHERIHQIIKRI